MEKNILNTHLADTVLSVRAIKILVFKCEVKTLNDLLSFDVRALKKARNCGSVTLTEVKIFQSKLRKINKELQDLIHNEPLTP